MLGLLRFLPRGLRRAILLRKVRFDAERLRDVRVRLAECPADYLGAARVRHDARVASGLMVPHPSRFAVNKFSILPTTWTFVAKRRDHVVATLSFLRDSPLKLPTDECFGSELDSLRGRGLALGEFSGLACTPEFVGSGLNWCLYRIAFEAAHRLGTERVVGRVVPQAACIYRDILQIDLLPGVRRDPWVMGKRMRGFAIEVQACEPRLRAVFARLGDHPANLHRFYFAKEPRFDIALPDGLEPGPAQREAAARLVLERPDIFQILAPGERLYLSEAIGRAVAS